VSKPLILKITVLLISTLTIMAGTPVSPVLPKIAVGFAGEANAELLSRLVLTMPALFTVFGAPLAGIIADRYGRKPLALASLALYAVAGTSGFFADTLQQILLGRALLGLAVGGCTTSAMALITDYYQGDERVRLLGIQGACITGGGVLFIGLGGFLAELGWRFPFLLYLAGALVLGLAALVLHEPERPAQTLEEKAGNGLPFGFLAVIYGIALVGNTCFFTVPVQMPFYLQGDFAVGGIGTGLILALATLFASATGFQYGRIRHRLSYGGILTLMFALMGCSYLVVGFATTLWVLVAGLCLSGVAAGMLFPCVNNWVSDITSRHNRGRAFGVVGTSLYLGQFIAPVVTAPLIARFPYGPFFAMLGAFLLVMAVTVRLAAGALDRHTRRLAT